MRDKEIPFGKAVLLIGSVLALFFILPLLVLYLGRYLGFGVALVMVLAILFFADVASMASWRTKPTVELPDTLKLSFPVERAGDHFETNVTINGESWRAIISDDGGPIPMVGDIVRVVERHGLQIELARYDNGA